MASTVHRLAAPRAPDARARPAAAAFSAWAARNARAFSADSAYVAESRGHSLIRPGRQSAYANSDARQRWLDYEGLDSSGGTFYNLFVFTTGDSSNRTDVELVTVTP